MLARIRSLIEGLFAVVSAVAKLGYVLLITCWQFIVLVVSFIIGFAPYLETMMTQAIAHVTAFVAVMVDAQQGMKEALEAGWPPEWANAVAFTNVYFPLAECATMLVTLTSAWVIMGLVRVFKSFIPGIN